MFADYIHKIDPLVWSNYPDVLSLAFTNIACYRLFRRALPRHLFIAHLINSAEYGGICQYIYDVSSHEVFEEVDRRNDIKLLMTVCDENHSFASMVNLLSPMKSDIGFTWYVNDYYASTKQMHCFLNALYKRADTLTRHKYLKLLTNDYDTLIQCLCETGPVTLLAEALEFADKSVLNHINKQITKRMVKRAPAEIVEYTIKHNWVLADHMVARMLHKRGYAYLLASHYQIM